MWSGNTPPYNRKYYPLEEPMNILQPLTKPHPPILIGGEGEKQTLRKVAEYGDACIFQLGTHLPDYPAWYIETYQQRVKKLAQKLAVLREHCQRVGRDYDEIEKTVLGSIKLAPDAPSVSQVIEVCHELAKMGFQQVIYIMPNIHEIKPLEVIVQEIIPQVAKL
jgi:alkanesulfonate monooxygenase SsuD/methylene tetrahydromethanopterin reductase-like flavin-dependent oxidoreductase (luciferase family)